VPRLLVIDNYDSFTFNLVQALAMLGADVTVRENDRVTLADVLATQPSHVVISPGPGRPEDAGASVSVMQAAIDGALGETQVLGVCLGHQCLALVAGGRVVSAQRLMHGRASPITHEGRGIFAGLPQPLVAGRYHSLAVEAASLPGSLTITARTDDGEIMALRHASGRVHGVQFHPESILTPDGPKLLERFLEGGAR
jgi:anthranilate synthase/aminodeoxychorismate synthase-like glutamine amidotransferase